MAIRNPTGSTASTDARVRLHVGVRLLIPVPDRAQSAILECSRHSWGNAAPPPFESVKVPSAITDDTQKAVGYFPDRTKMTANGTRRNEDHAEDCLDVHTLPSPIVIASPAAACKRLSESKKTLDSFLSSPHARVSARRHKDVLPRPAAAPRAIGNGRVCS
jgi:hypothetical protein